jgi:hypothetical protein
MSHYVHAGLCVSILDLKAKGDMVPISTEPTLADVIARHELDAMLTPKRRRDLKSAVLRMSEITGVDPRITTASLRFMRPRINAVRPAKHNLTPKTWSNLRSNFRAAVVQAEPRQPRRSDTEWTALRAALRTERMKKGLSRMIGFCENNSISPTAVCDSVSEGFLAHLEADTNVPCPYDRHRLACRLWNRAVETVPGWPSIRLSVPDTGEALSKSADRQLSGEPAGRACALPRVAWRGRPVRRGRRSKENGREHGAPAGSGAWSCPVSTR